MKSLIEYYLGTTIKFRSEKEGTEYKACSFEVNNLKYRGRRAKITSKKKGQFVTFWKRPDKEIAPYSQEDEFNFLIVFMENESSYFLFPKQALIKHGIISTPLKEGKRAFRLYHPEEKDLNKQALKTQKWQGDYFISD